MESEVKIFLRSICLALSGIAAGYFGNASAQNNEIVELQFAFAFSFAVVGVLLIMMFFDN